MAENKGKRLIIARRVHLGMVGDIVGFSLLELLIAGLMVLFCFVNMLISISIFGLMLFGLIVGKNYTLRFGYARE